MTLARYKNGELTDFCHPCRSEHHRPAATMTEAEALEKKQHKSGSGNVAPETVVEDTFDHTYREKEGPKPPMVIVWRNVILMTLLHIGAVYGMLIIPSASHLTLLWCK